MPEAKTGPEGGKVFNMADADKDWDNFMAAAKEDLDEVETDEELEDENLEDEEAETEEDDQTESDEDGKKPKSKSTEAPKKGDENAEEETETEEEDESKKTDQPYKPRLKLFLNDKGEFDVKKAEEAYIASSKESVKNAKTLEKVQNDFKQILDAIAAKPDMAKELFGEEGAKKFLADRKTTQGASASAGTQQGTQASNDPIVQHMEAQFQRQSNEEYNEFVEAHPEAVTDPEKSDKIGKFLEMYGPWYRKNHNGEIAGMKESLEAAYRFHGWDLGTTKEEDVAIAAKRTAATRSSSQSKKPASKQQRTSMEQFFAKKLGVSLGKKKG